MRPTLLLLAVMASLSPAADPEPLVRLGSDRFRQAERVESIAYSPDGKQLATVDEERVHIWDAADGRLLRTIPGGPKHHHVALCFAADGKVVYWVSWLDSKEVTFRQLDPVAGKQLSTTQLAPKDTMGGYGISARFSPDGAWLAVANDDLKLLRVFRTHDGKEVWSDRGDKPVYTANFLPDGKRLAVARNRQVRIIEAGSWKVLHEYAVEGGAFSMMEFSPDGKTAVAENRDPWPPHLVAFDAETGTIQWSCKTDQARDLIFTPDGKAVIYRGRFGNDNNHMWHWVDAATGRHMYRAMDAGFGYEVAVRSDGNVLAVGGYHGQITQWDLTTRKRLEIASADPPDAPAKLRFASDGSKLIGWARGWYEWDLKTGKQTRLTPVLDVGASENFAVSQDQKWLAREIRSNNLKMESFALTELATGRRHVLPRTSSAEHAHFLPDGRLLVRRENRLSIYDTETGNRVAQLALEGKVGAMAVNERGTAAMSVALNGDRVHGKQWDLLSAKPIAEWDGRHPDATMLARSHSWHAQLSPDGRIVAVFFTYLAFQGMGFNDIHELRTELFDARTGRHLSGWGDLHFRVDLAFSPDGRTVACYYQSGLGVDIREVATGERRTRRPNPPVMSAAFSPDGRTLALGTSPSPVALWDLIGKPSRKWNDEKTAVLWNHLASADSNVAFEAIRVLRQHPTEAIGYLKERLLAAKAPAADWLAARIKDLDAANFKQREQASTDLAAAGELVAPGLRDALKAASPEMRQRLEALLTKVEAPTPEQCRATRACEVLEGIATPEARELLAAWSKGAPGATLTREAMESVERLNGRR
ncbi:MAG TPA: WD40 repeat domain-containing protein [Gemmataceae bacterium]|jgi:WD40 repeat protein|nr:WD40 repeat domain-containing protein [Gemmataceae bacterium]